MINYTRDLKSHCFICVLALVRLPGSQMISHNYQIVLILHVPLSNSGARILYLGWHHVIKIFLEGGKCLKKKGIEFS